MFHLRSVEWLPRKRLARSGWDAALDLYARAEMREGK